MSDFSGDLPGDLKYTNSHEWVRENPDGTVQIGITDHAQNALGELVFVELPEVGAEVSAGEACVVVESVKAASDVYSPVSGEVIAVNQALEDAPEIINKSAFEEGWIMVVKLKDPQQLEALLDSDSYQQTLEEV